jgi:hypothetical protein
MKRPLVLLFSALLLTTPLAADELLQLTIDPITRSDDGNTATALVVLRNKTGADITDIDLDLVLTTGGNAVTLTAANHPAWGQLWSCTNTAAQSVRCHLPLFHGGPDANSWPFVPLVATIDGANEGRFSLTGHASGKAGAATLTSTYEVKALYEREVAITNTSDANEGSLRAAIEYANDTCARDHVPCALRFLFTDALPAQGWYTIRPLTPLPAITAPDISIERNFHEPKVELDGSLLTTGHGLQLRGKGLAIIDGLSIGHFPWNGIAITRSGGTAVFSCAIGVRPDGQPNPNGSRGVTIDPPASDVYLGSNRISANVRSGVFIAGGEHITISGNVIGTHVFETAFNPLLGNGAAGIFVGPAARGVEVDANYLGANAAGITVARGARGVSVDNNWIDSNNGLSIDHDLDGFSGYTKKPGEFALPAPRLESATYDQATQKVTIRGTFDAPEAGTAWKLTLTGDSIGIWPEKSLDQFEFTGTTFTVTFLTFGSNSFSATVGSAAPTDWSTSEFSDPIAFTR